MNRKIALVNYRSRSLKSLIELATRFGEITLFTSLKELKLSVVNYQPDLVVLSGSFISNIIRDAHTLSEEILYIQASEIPMIGVCFGAQLMAYSYGAEIIKLDRQINSLIKLEICENDAFQLVDKSITTPTSIIVKEAHRWAISSLPQGLVQIAKSENGCEIFKHREKNHFGLQFHPELEKGRTDGNEIFERIVEVVSRKGLKM